MPTIESLLKKISPFLIWAIIILGVALRTFQADRFPIDNNDDGLFYAWAGISFLQNPTNVMSHTIFDTGNGNLIWRAQFKDYIPHERFGMKYTTSWFDHPPFGMVLIGFPAWILDYQAFEQIPHLIVRYPALIASIFTLWFTFLLARNLFDKKIALITTVVLATTPYMVFAHRQSYLENFLTPFFLASLLLTNKILQQKSAKPTLLATLCVLTFLCGWIKVVGFSVPFMIGGYLLTQKKSRSGWLLLAAGFASVLSYIAYGLLTDASSFLATLQNQGDRGGYLLSFFTTLTRVQFYGSFSDGLYLLGWISGISLMLRPNSPAEKFLRWFWLAWLGVFFLTSGQHNNSAWYTYQILPFLAIALALFVQKIWDKQALGPSIIFFLLASANLLLLRESFPALLTRVATLLYFAILFGRMVYPHPVLQKISLYTTRLFLVAIVLLNIFVVLKYPSTQCTATKHCLLPAKIQVNK